MASAVAEWMTMLLAEAKHGMFDIRTRDQVKAVGLSESIAVCRDELPKVHVTGITDCKSL